MDVENYQTLHAHVVRTKNGPDSASWRRHCGCLKTSDKLKQLLKSFPSPPPPPTPVGEEVEKATSNPFDVNYVSVAKCRFPNVSAHSKYISASAYCAHDRSVTSPIESDLENEEDEDVAKLKNSINRGSWRIVSDLVQLLQLAVTATALALYYLIYCYMQLVYYTLRSALYFHNADLPMKVTIGVVTLTSILVGFNLLIRMERLIGVF